MTTHRAVVAYRYSVADIDTWSERLVEIFYQRLSHERGQQ